MSEPQEPDTNRRAIVLNWRIVPPGAIHVSPGVPVGQNDVPNVQGRLVRLYLGVAEGMEQHDARTVQIADELATMLVSIGATEAQVFIAGAEIATMLAEADQIRQGTEGEA